MTDAEEEEKDDPSRSRDEWGLEEGCGGGGIGLEPLREAEERSGSLLEKSDIVCKIEKHITFPSRTCSCSFPSSSFSLPWPRDPP